MRLEVPNASAPVALLLAGMVAACGDATITSPVPAIDGAEARVESAASVLQLPLATITWNARARDLVATMRIDPPMAARYYALLSIAQQRAVATAQPEGREGVRRHVAVRAAIVGASAEVLAYAFPGHAAVLQQWERADLELLAQAHSARGADLPAAVRLGEDAAMGVIVAALTDGADAVWEPNVPTGPGKWFPSSASQQPLRPLWGHVRPWLLQRGDQFRPPPPPAIGSREFTGALAEVRRISDTRSAEQLRIARFWADGAGTATPPGHWNAIAADLAERHALNEARAAEMFALLNMSLMDASIACWEAKYAYWLLRPSQADPAITTPVGLPPFPSYVSGHATFSGAAATFLGEVFPASRRDVAAMADEAAESRLFGGIHYRFDNDEGLALGRKIGALAVERLRGSGR